MGLRKRIAPLLAGVLVLSGCAAPAGETATPTPAGMETLSPAPSPAPEEVKELWGFPIDNTHDAFEVPTGGRLGTVLVTVEMLDDELIYPSLISVWSTDDLTEPIQTMEVEGVTTGHRELVDANFDGHMDFSYVWFLGAKNDEYGLYVWDEEQGRFAPEERFLGHLTVDGDNGTIRNYAGGGGGRGTEEIFRWEDGELALARRLEIGYSEDDGVKQLLTVEDSAAGERKEYHFDISGEDGDIWDEARLWYDLDYHGEDIETLWGFPIDDTHDAFEVPTGGRLGTVLVTVELAENEEMAFGGELQFAVWAADDLEKPLQTMAAEWVSSFHWNDVVDANFDGYMDFCYMYAMGNQPCYWHYWIWNEEQGLFIAEPEFDQISWPQFDEETGVISGWARSSALSTGRSTFHRWIDGKLVCVRRIESFAPAFEDKVILTVEDRIDGALTEVFREEYSLVEENAIEWFSIESKWENLDYHGE